MCAGGASERTAVRCTKEHRRLVLLSNLPCWHTSKRFSCNRIQPAAGRLRMVGPRVTNERTVNKFSATATGIAGTASNLQRALSEIETGRFARLRCQWQWPAVPSMISLYYSIAALTLLDPLLACYPLACVSSRVEAAIGHQVMNATD